MPPPQIRFCRVPGWWTRFAFITICLLGLGASACPAQRLSTANIRAKADSVLRREVGAEVFRHCRYEDHSFYSYITARGRRNSARLTKHAKTRGKLTAVRMFYRVQLPYPNCPAYDTISGSCAFDLDEKLRATSKPELDFVPDSYWQKQDCHLISADQALDVARSQGLQAGIKPLKAYLWYEEARKQFVWTIHNYLTVDRYYGTMPEGRVEVVKLDAVAGTVIEHGTNWYGPIR
jgi:hypothetical protein